MDAIAIIPARGGSKGVPRKNVRTVAGKPLLAWTIEAARQSRVQRVIVSTDCPDVAAAARAWGADVPFMRPAALAGDDAPVAETLLHALAALQYGPIAESAPASEAPGRPQPEFVVLLQPTSPLRTSGDIDAALALACSSGAPAVASVCEAPAHPFLVRRCDAQGVLSPFLPLPQGYLRRQDFPSAYALTGAVYVIRTQVLQATGAVFPEGTVGCVLPVERSLDVDTEWDLHLAELILRDRHVRRAA